MLTEFGLINEFLAALRPLIKTDEAVRALVINRVIGDEYGRNEDAFYGHYLLDLLLDELPDSEQAKYLLNYLSFQSLGEDGMITRKYHRMLERRFPHDPWFRRQVEHASDEHALLLSHEYLGKDLRSDDKDLIRQWAKKNSKYLPMVGPGEIHQIVAHHPGYDLEVFDFPSEMLADLRAIQSIPTLSQRLGYLLRSQYCQNDWRKGNAVFEELVKELNPESISVVCSLAEEKANTCSGQAKVWLLKQAPQSDQIQEWIRSYIYTDVARKTEWQSLLAQHGMDRDLAHAAAQQVVSNPTADFHASFFARDLRRLCMAPLKLPENEGVALLQQALAHPVFAKEPYHVLAILAEAYPGHPETRNILRACGSATYLRKLDGLTPEVIQLALQAPKLDWEIAAILRDAASEAAFARLMRTAMQSEGPYWEHWERASAITALSEGYAQHLGVKEWLLQMAREEVPDWNVLKMLALHFSTDPQVMNLFFELGSKVDYRNIPAELYDYLCDPDYRGWVGSLPGKHHSFLETMSLPGKQTEQKRHQAAFMSAIWFGHLEETLETHLKHANDDPFVLSNCVFRWHDHPKVLALVQASLQPTHLREAAARLLSRAYSTHPDTPTLLRQHIHEGIVCFSEYMGLCMGNLPAMHEGLAVLEQISTSRHESDLAEYGPTCLLRFFGPRKDLRAALIALGAKTENTHLQKGILNATEEYYPR